MKKVTEVIRGSFHEFHEPNCGHLSRGVMPDGVYETEVEAHDLKSLIYALECEGNADFASDYGMTVEEYLASGEGYRIGTGRYSEWRVFPCVKF